MVHPTPKITMKFKLLIKSPIRRDEDVRNIFGWLNSKHFIQIEEEEWIDTINPHNVGIIFKGNVNSVMKYAILDTRIMLHLYIIVKVINVYIFFNKTNCFM